MLRQNQQIAFNPSPAARLLIHTYQSTPFHIISVGKQSFNILSEGFEMAETYQVREHYKAYVVGIDNQSGRQREPCTYAYNFKSDRFKSILGGHVMSSQSLAPASL